MPIAFGTFRYLWFWLFLELVMGRWKIAVMSLLDVVWTRLHPVFCSVNSYHEKAI